jgi:hypothetical protein
MPEIRECGMHRRTKGKEMFDTEGQAMDFYKSSIRPGLEKLMREATRDQKDATLSIRRLEQ